MKSNNTIPVLKMSDLMDGVLDFFKYLLQKIRLALLLIILGLGFSLGFYLMQQPKYAGKVSFILEEKSGGMGGGISGLASQFGFDIGGLTGSAGLFAGDNILDILKSRTIIEKVLLSRVDSATNLKSATLADSYLLWSGLHEKWKKNTALSTCNFTHTIAGKANTRLQDSVLLVIYQQLTKKYVTAERLNKKGSIIEVVTTSPNEIFSKLFTERLVLETMRMYVDLKTSVAAKNIRRMEQRSDSLMQLLNTKSYKSANLQVLDANIAFKSSAVPVELSQRDKSVTYALYTEVMKNLEASRMALAGQTPVINLLDNAKYPLEDQQIPLLKLIFIGVFGGLGLMLVLAFITYAPSPSPDLVTTKTTA
ncbi:MAG: hypothetical protein EAZ35_03175 [Sphingobacteriia bacterium]|nr:MAG: hypothetical protein EAZ35_03175 [Sphingobacteriia bacterium]